MQQPPDYRIVAARIGLNEPTGMLLLHRVEELIGDCDKTAMRWGTDVSYEPGAAAPAGRLEPGHDRCRIAELVGEV